MKWVDVKWDIWAALVLGLPKNRFQVDSEGAHFKTSTGCE